MLVSLLLSQGHPSAAQYPLCTLFTEARIAKHRINMELATQAILVQSALVSIHGGKDGQKAFTKLIKGLVDGP
jgi:hypothetical protein